MVYNVNAVHSSIPDKREAIKEDAFYLEILDEDIKKIFSDMNRWYHLLAMIYCQKSVTVAIKGKNKL